MWSIEKFSGHLHQDKRLSNAEPTQRLGAFPRPRVLTRQRAWTRPVPSPDDRVVRRGVTVVGAGTPG